MPAHKSLEQAGNVVLQNGLSQGGSLPDCEGERRLAGNVLPGDVGPVRQKLFDRVRVVAHGGEHEGGAAVLVLGVDGRAFGQEGAHHVVMTVGCCQVEGCLGLGRCGIYILQYTIYTQLITFGRRIRIALFHRSKFNISKLVSKYSSIFKNVKAYLFDNLEGCQLNCRKIGAFPHSELLILVSTKISFVGL